MTQRQGDTTTTIDNNDDKQENPSITMKEGDQPPPTENDHLLGDNDNNNKSRPERGHGHGRGHHHRRESSMLPEFLDTIVENMEHMAENVQDMASDIKHVIEDEYHAIADEAHDVKDTFMDELTEKDDGESILLEMALTRNLSILPSDLEQAAADAQEQREEEQQQQQQQQQQQAADDETKPILPGTIEDARKAEEAGEEAAVPFHAYLILASAVIALSSIGPSLDMQRDVEPTMKIYWRMTGTAIFLFPFALQSTIKHGPPRMSHTRWCTFGCAATCYAIMTVGFVIALDFTSVGNAVIFANSQAVLLLLGKFLVGASVLFLEGAGAVIAFGGAILCTVDASATTTTTTTTTAVANAATTSWSGWGDILALIAGLGGVGYLVFAKSVRSYFPTVYVFMFMNMFCASLVTLLYMLLSGQHVTIDRNINTGLYGFLNTRYDRLPLELYMVVVCNMTGSLGYVRSMQYFDNIIISVAALVEPVVASLLACMIGVGVLPGILGWLGNVLVAVGTVCVILPSAKKGEAAGH